MTTTVPRHSLNDQVVLYNYPAKVPGNTGCFANRCPADVFMGKPDFIATAEVQGFSAKASGETNLELELFADGQFDPTGHDFIGCLVRIASLGAHGTVKEYENRDATVALTAHTSDLPASGDVQIEIFCGNFVGYNFNEATETIEFVKCPFIGGDCLPIKTKSHPPQEAYEHTCEYSNEHTGVLTGDGLYTVKYTHLITSRDGLVTLEWPTRVENLHVGTLRSSTPIPAEYRPRNGARITISEPVVGDGGVDRMELSFLRVGSDGFIEFSGSGLGECSVTYHT